ncbi:MAG: VWA domain-containing protein [Acidobacteria bacterium]|nr:VWA domain-containing protein [Acidobacteriota bacterium]
MNFLSPLFFLGGLAALLPVLLHLVRRERSEKLEFPTLMFLRRVSKRAIRYQKLRHLILLLLRIATLLLIALAFTRPFSPAPRASTLAGRAPEAHLILIDNSMSMAYGDRWARAREAAADVIRQARPGDRVGLVEFSNRSVVRSPLSADFAALEALVRNNLELTDRPTRYGQALRMAQQAVFEAGTSRRIVHMISDFQRTGWAADEQDFRLSGGIEIRAVNVGGADYSNLAPAEVQVIEKESEREKSEYIVRFSIANFGTRDRNGAGVSLAVDDQVLRHDPVTVEKGRVARVEFNLPPLAPGPHALLISLEDDMLNRDDRFALMLQVRRRAPVLAVENPRSSRSGRSASFFLSHALNLAGISPYQLSTLSPAQAESAAISLPELVVWNNISGAGPGMHARLREHVTGGGGLALVVADDSAAQDFNRAFAGWLPVRADPQGGPGGRRGNPRPLEDFLLLTDIRSDHPIFRPFSEPHSGNFSRARFYGHVRLEVSEGAQVLARFDNGDPAVVSVDHGEGKVVILPFAADDSTNDLPLKAVYAPFWQQVLRHMQKYRQERRWSEVGDPIEPRAVLAEAAWQPPGDSRAAGQAVVVLDPRGERVPLPPGAERLVAEHAGFYEVRTSTSNSRIAVNTVPHESDITPGDADVMIAGWTSEQPGDPPGDQPAGDLTVEQRERQQGLWRYLLIGAILFFGVEGWLSNRSALRPE